MYGQGLTTVAYSDPQDGLGLKGAGTYSTLTCHWRWNSTFAFGTKTHPILMSRGLRTFGRDV